MTSEELKEERTKLAIYFNTVGIITGWITCSLFWWWMGWLPS